MTVSVEELEEPAASDGAVKSKAEGEEDLLYAATKNPQNRKNIDLHRLRYRENLFAAADQSPEADSGPPVLDVQAQQEHYANLYASTDWPDHVHVNDLDVFKFVIDPQAQRMIYKLQVGLVDEPFNAFGKTEGSWDGYTLMFRNGWSKSGDVRKPITDLFLEYCEEVYCPIIWAMLFGPGWESIKKHYGTFKSCTIKVTEDTSFYGEPIFHMHIDGKIGLLEEKNYTQRHMNRLLFSIVTEALDDEANAAAYKYGTTVYPIWQPRTGFRNNHEFHKYMQKWYLDRGLENSGLPRPHYEIPEALLYRAVPGEILVHKTHGDSLGPQAIHSEPNPCPDRHLFVFDWNNIINHDAKGKVQPSTEVPEQEIVEHMRALADCSCSVYRHRLQFVAQTAEALLPQADKYPGGRGALEHFLQEIAQALQ